MAEASSDQLDDFQDLHHLSESQVFGSSASQASSYYGDGDEVCVNLIKNYSSQSRTPDGEARPVLEVANVVSSTQTSTATESSSITIAASQTSFGTTGTTSTAATSLTSLGSSSSLGKRKASDRLGSEPSSPKRKQPFPQLREPLQDAEPQFKKQPAEVIDPSEPVVLSPPNLMLSMVRKLPYGAQFEIVRLVSQNRLKYNDLEVQDIVGILTKCHTNATAAPEILKLILSKRGEEDVPQADDNDDQFVLLSGKELRARNPWEELDREDTALAVSPYGAMGYQEDGRPAGWYGGQVQFRGTLHRDNLFGASQFALKLEKPVLGPSSQLTRRLGSQHFVRVRLSKQAKNHSQGAYEYLRKPFIICGHVYRAFFAKDDNAFLVRTNESWDGRAVSPGTKPVGRATSFLDFIKWFNSLDLNEAQPMAKWASRFSLGLSTSAPGFRLDRDHIEFRDDLVNETKENMTDGAGTLNRTLVRYLRHHYDWKERPTAFQVRVYGSKGLLIEDARDSSDKPAICLTPSQQKIKYPDSDDDPSHLAVDILRASHLKTPCRLSTEIIVNLAENGVGKESFIMLLENSLKETIGPFFDWDSEGALQRIWQILERKGGVIASRRAREQPGIARVKGWAERDIEENEVDDGEQLDGARAEQRSTPWWPDVISGCPSGLEETVMFLLDAGFTPGKCAVLRDKLKKIIQIYVSKETRAFRVEVPMSATSFIVPDWTGLLAEGEVFMKSSERNLELPDGSVTDVLVGDVLLARHPCKLPTDVRKWKAVDKPELHGLVDVIVLPTKGKRRAADWLAGGDYDGDKAIIIWQPELVDPFRNAPESYADAPANISECFERKIEQVASFRQRIEGLPDAAKILELQHYLLGAIRVRSVVGQYSNCHEVATYMRGYDDAETRRLAFMFCMTLDGAKSGMTVKQTTYSDDVKKYGSRSPAWKEWKEMKDMEDAHSGPGRNNLPAHPRRKRGAARFIMDELKHEAESQAQHWGKQIDAAFNNIVDEEDPVLTAPYREILSKIHRPGGEYYRADLELIKRHVEQEYDAYNKSTIKEQRIAGGQQSPRKSPRKGAAFTERPIEERQDILRAASKRFAMTPDPDTLFMTQEQAERVKASFAYFRDCHHKNWDSDKDGPREGSKMVHCTRFPFNVAFRTLCDIKAKSLGNHKTVCSSFYEHVVVKPPKPQHRR